MNAESLLLTASEAAAALGPRARLSLAQGQVSEKSIGDVLRAAASDSAYRHFRGGVTVDGIDHPMAAGIMVLIFDLAAKAEHTFREVAQAAHLRTQVEGADVAVETVTAPSGLVSYWGFVHQGAALVILTLDTLDPQYVSIADLRSLVAATASRLTAMSSPADLPDPSKDNTLETGEG